MLGAWYDGETDAFSFRFKQMESVSTMRQLTAAVASLFDPLGMVAPVVLIAKTMIQECWKAEIHWDDQLPEDLLRRWSTCYQELETLNRLQLPRSLKTPEFRQCTTFQMHIFCDASEIGFGAVAYARWQLDETVIIRFIMAKTRVAPIKPPLTIPKLELQAAVLAHRMAGSIAVELLLNEKETTFWTDSQTVLQWIGSKHYMFDRFTNNRVGEILNTTDAEQWRHVPGLFNPDDESSRGLYASELHNNHRFLSGPDFLKLDKEEWPPTLPIQLLSSLCTTEEPQTEVMTYPSLKIVDKYSELSKILRLVCRLRQVICAWKTRNIEQTEWSFVIEAGDFQQALYLCIQNVQSRELKKDYEKLLKTGEVSRSSRLRMPTTFLDPSGIIRVGGRLKHSSLQYEEKHPIVLPDHKLTKLIVQDVHQRFHHCGPERTFYEAGAQYWIFGGRRLQELRG